MSFVTILHILSHIKSHVKETCLKKSGLQDVKQMSINVTFNVQCQKPLQNWISYCSVANGTNRFFHHTQHQKLDFMLYKFMLSECSIITNGEFSSYDRCIHKQKLSNFPNKPHCPFSGQPPLGFNHVLIDWDLPEHWSKTSGIWKVDTVGFPFIKIKHSPTFTGFWHATDRWS